MASGGGRWLAAPRCAIRQEENGGLVRAPFRTGHRNWAEDAQRRKPLSRGGGAGDWLGGLGTSHRWAQVGCRDEVRNRCRGQKGAVSRTSPDGEPGCRAGRDRFHSGAGKGHARGRRLWLILAPGWRAEARRRGLAEARRRGGIVDHDGLPSASGKPSPPSSHRPPWTRTSFGAPIRGRLRQGALDRRSLVARGRRWRAWPPWTRMAREVGCRRRAGGRGADRLGSLYPLGPRWVAELGWRWWRWVW